MSASPATALVIDDESMVRLLVRRMLEPHVCSVIEAGDGESALRLLEREPAIDVVLTDLVMPGIDGFDIVDVLSVHRPGLPVICMSGFSSAGAARLGVPLVSKPFSLETLLSAMEPLLARASQLRQSARVQRLRAEEGRADSERLRRISDAHCSVAVDLVAAARALRRERP